MIPAVYDSVSNVGLKDTARCGVVRALYEIADTEFAILCDLNIRFLDAENIISKIGNVTRTGNIVIGKQFAGFGFSWMGAPILHVSMQGRLYLHPDQTGAQRFKGQNFTDLLLPLGIVVTLYCKFAPDANVCVSFPDY